MFPFVYLRVPRGSLFRPTAKNTKLREGKQKRSYNELMSHGGLRRRSKPDSKRAQQLETIGLIIIVILIFAITITRSCHHINWSAR